ncbi:MAG: glycosyltransferase [Clostridia bacterium]|nr:glycosyltransferase [Clostridia bacterium]
MKVLVLTVSAGQGHNQTAIAISEYLERQGADSRVLDAYKYANQFLSDSIEKGYLMSTRYLPTVFGKCYRAAEKSENNRHKNTSISRLTNSMVGQKLLSYIEEYKPDVIITTHIFTALHLTYLSPHLGDILTIGIVTDFTIHPYWENTDLDYYVTASHLLNYQCARKGIPPHKILPFGIPIREKFSQQLSCEEARKQVGIENKTTILIMMGSMGYGNMVKNVQQIDQIDMDFQILCVCGNNARAKRNIDKLETKHNLKTFGFIDNVAVMMDAADFMITKPGGLTLSEALAKGLPVILINPIPGHEDRNQEFLINNGLAMAVSDTCTLDEAVFQFLQNDWRRKHLREGIRYIAKSNPTKLLGDFIFNEYEKEFKHAGAAAHPECV